MPDIFDSHPGSVVRVQASRAETFEIRITGYGGFPTQRAIALGLSAVREAKLAVQESLANSIHIYTMGQKPIPILLNGMFFQDACEGGVQGFDALNSYYDEHNVSDREQPITLTVGRRSWQALFIRMDAALTNPQFNFGQFAFNFLAMPGVSQ